MPTRAAPPARLLRAHLGRLAIAAALGPAILLGGCSDSGAAPAAEGTSPTSTATDPARGAATGVASPVPTVETPPAAPRAARGQAGERAFARHVMDLWAYALRTNDAKPLSALGVGTKPCGGCAALTHELGRRRTQGWTVDLAGVRVKKFRITRQGDVQVVRAGVDIPQSDSYNADGTFRNTSPAHPGATFEVQMRLTDRRYRLVSFTVS